MSGAGEFAKVMPFLEPSMFPVGMTESNDRHSRTRTMTQPSYEIRAVFSMWCFAIGYVSGSRRAVAKGRGVVHEQMQRIARAEGEAYAGDKGTRRVILQPAQASSSVLSNPRASLSALFLL